MVILYKKNHLAYTRVAFVSSKKVGNSVQRNRARRLMKESKRLLGNDLRNGYDVIFVARKNIILHNSNDVRKSMYGVLRSINLL